MAALAASEAAALPSPDSVEAIIEDIRVDPLEIELAADLIDLVDRVAGGDLLDRVKSLRRKVATDLGVVVPPVRTRDNLDLPLHTYAIRLFGVEVARGEAPPGHGAGHRRPPRRAARPPYPGAGLRAGRRLGARSSCATRRRCSAPPSSTGPRCSPPTSPRWCAATPRSCSAARRSRCSPTRSGAPTPSSVDELTPALLSLGEIQQVLQSLLDESVSIRDLPRIFEALSTRARIGKDLDGLVTAARETLGLAVVAPHLRDGTLPVLSFDPGLEQRLLEALRVSEGGGFLALDLDLSQALMNDLTARNRQAEDQNISAVLVCAPQVRPAVRRLVATTLPRLPVLSYGELGGPIQIQSVGVVGGQAPALA